MFFLPFTLVLGIAAQGAGLYVLGWLLPLLFAGVIWRREGLPWLRVGAALAGLYLLFPLWNVVVSWGGLEFPPDAVLVWPRKLKELASNSFSSSLLFSGVFAIAAGVLAQRPRAAGTAFSSDALPTARNGERRGPSPAGAFSAGLAVAMTALAAYVALQHVTGIDLRTRGGMLPPSELMPNGTYRSLGFFGHPLSLGGFALGAFAWLAMLWLGSLREVEGGEVDKSLRPANLTPKAWSALLVTGTFASLWCVVASGGRTPLVVAAGMVVLLPLITWGRRAPKRAIAASVVGLALCAAVGLQSGVGERLKLVADSLAGKTGDKRVIYWSIYRDIIEVQPWLGSGPYWLREVVRPAMFAATGHGDLDPKFHAHNMPLEILAQVGIVGAVLVLALGMFLFRTLWLSSRASLSTRLLFTGCCAGVAANALHGLTQNSFFDSNVLYVHLVCALVLLWQIAWERARAEALRISDDHPPFQ